MWENYQNINENHHFEHKNQDFSSIKTANHFGSSPVIQKMKVFVRKTHRRHALPANRFWCAEKFKIDRYAGLLHGVLIWPRLNHTNY